jgi:hypothetical protein
MEVEGFFTKISDSVLDKVSFFHPVRIVLLKISYQVLDFPALGFPSEIITTFCLLMILCFYSLNS